VSDPYEPPIRPEVTVETGAEDVGESLAKILHQPARFEYIPWHVMESCPQPQEGTQILARPGLLGNPD
jgi:hypothetical protein